MRLLQDWQFGAALIVAPVVWILSGQFLPTTPNIGWPLDSPDRFLILVVLYPIFEELAFRGWLQSTLYSHSFGHRQLAGISFANLITSLIFTGLHFLYHSPLWATFVLIPSLLFGYFRDRYKSVKPAIILHIFYNCGNYWVFGAT
jgi:hypothetical protein